MDWEEMSSSMDERTGNRGEVRKREKDGNIFLPLFPGAIIDLVFNLSCSLSLFLIVT